MWERASWWVCWRETGVLDCVYLGGPTATAIPAKSPGKITSVCQVNLPDPRHVMEGLAEAPAGRCPRLSPGEEPLDHGRSGSGVSLRYPPSALARGHRSIFLPAPAKPSPAQRMSCHSKTYLVLFIIWSLFFH